MKAAGKAMTKGGPSASVQSSCCFSGNCFLDSFAMLPPMRSMKAAGKAMTKGALTKALATEHGLKQKACSEMINSVVAIATKEVKATGIFTLPGVCRIKTRLKPATKAGVRMMFGKETKVKARPAKTIVKAFPVAALKKQI